MDARCPFSSSPVRLHASHLLAMGHGINPLAKGNNMHSPFSGVSDGLREPISLFLGLLVFCPQYLFTDLKKETGRACDLVSNDRALRARAQRRTAETKKSCGTDAVCFYSVASSRCRTCKVPLSLSGEAFFFYISHAKESRSHPLSLAYMTTLAS